MFDLVRLDSFCTYITIFLTSFFPFVFGDSYCATFKFSIIYITFLFHGVLFPPTHLLHVQYICTVLFFACITQPHPLYVYAIHIFLLHSY